LVTPLTQPATIDYGSFYNCSPDALIRLTGRAQLNRNARRNSNTKFLRANIARLSFPLYEVLFVIAFAERQAPNLGKINWGSPMNEANVTQQTGSGTREAQGKLQSGRTHARQAAEDFKSAASAIAEEYRGKAEQAWDDAKGRVRTFQQDADQYVRENPTKAVFTALGVGFVLGLIFRR
jgi:ElaB/YqjD/DUF883 family membrane-anchored ribosome-binding protein